MDMNLQRDVETASNVLQASMVQQLPQAQLSSYMPYFKAAFALKIRANGQAQMLGDFASKLSAVDQDYKSQALRQAENPLFLELKETWRKVCALHQAI